MTPLSGIMANDWFMFRRPAASITGTSCIFFVQVVFVGIGSELAWPGLCQPGHGDSRAQPHHAIDPVCVCRTAALSLSLEGIMTLPASALPVELPPAFLGVSRSATGKLWRDRLDARGAARALAITQRYQLPEMLARVLAGRDVGIDEVEDFLDPTIRKLMPDPHTVTAMEAAAPIVERLAGR